MVFWQQSQIKCIYSEASGFSSPFLFPSYRTHYCWSLWQWKRWWVFWHSVSLQIVLTLTMSRQIAWVAGPCGTLHLVWNGAWHCHSAIQWLLPGEGTSAAVMHAATDADREPIKKKKKIRPFLNRALGNYPNDCSVRKPCLHTFINLGSRREQSPALSGEGNLLFQWRKDQKKKK